MKKHSGWLVKPTPKVKPSQAGMGMVAHSYEVAHLLAEWLGIQKQSQLQEEFKASQG